ncbi:MAG: 4Fe-4S cluster-binding domain-containing protein [Thermoplasmata archaeon]
MKVKKWLKGSAYTGRLPEGCIHCARGGKLVLLVTGRCRAGCYYCPLSRRKRGKQVVYADEMRAKDDADILREAELIRATGTGVTGGDPLIQPAETARLIKLLKDNFGQRHHIHLYTACTERHALDIVAKAGLDEIRFHPPWTAWGALENTAFPEAFEHSKDLGLEAGVEIPALPGTRASILELLRTAERSELSFVNLNELEFSYTNWKALRKRGFDVKNGVSNAVRGSQALALSILRRAPQNVSVHYCSASFKDSVQLRRRISRRARSIKRPIDIITRDGTIKMGIIETRNPDKIITRIVAEFGVPKRYIEFNEEMNRIEIAPWVLEDIADELGEDAFLIEEYPTADRLEVERERLSSRRH